MSEDIREYINRRAEILRQTTSIAERLSTAWHRQAAQLPNRRINIGEARYGMGWPYKVVDSILESSESRLGHRAYLIRPYRRGLLLFTDPIYELTFIKKKPEDMMDDHAPSVLILTYMGNGEIEVFVQNREKYNDFWRSYQLQTLDSLRERLSTCALSSTVEALGLDPLIFMLQ